MLKLLQDPSKFCPRPESLPKAGTSSLRMDCIGNKAPPEPKDKKSE